MRNLHGILTGRVSSIRKRVVKSTTPRTRRTASSEASHPGFAQLSAKLARASAQIQSGRHGRRTG